MPELLAQRAALFVALSLRPLALFFATPPFSRPQVPWLARLGLAGAIALLLFPGYARLHPDAGLSLATLVSEPLTGLILAFTVRLAFAAVELAGQLLDIDAGINLSQVLDPVTGTPQQVLGGLQVHLATTLYLILGGHRALLASLADSYRQVPLADLSLSPALANTALTLASGLFSDGVRIALPVLTATMLTTVALAAATRAFPEANAFALGQPVKLAAALIALVALLPLYAGVITDLFGSSNTGLHQLLDLLSADRPHLGRQ